MLGQKMKTLVNSTSPSHMNTEHLIIDAHALLTIP